MKIKGAEITEISHSPSGQVVAHVTAEDGHKFLMPFGPPVTIYQIVKAVEEEVSSGDMVKAYAAHLHAELTKTGPFLPWYRKLWVVLSWYFRSHK